jgi:hypothetical protein
VPSEKIKIFLGMSFPPHQIRFATSSEFTPIPKYALLVASHNVRFAREPLLQRGEYFVCIAQ